MEASGGQSSHHGSQQLGEVCLTHGVKESDLRPQGSKEGDPRAEPFREQALGLRHPGHCWAMLHSQALGIKGLRFLSL